MEGAILKYHDHNIGKEFLTPSGATLTISSWEGDTIGKVKKVKKYLCDCSTCSKDTELWATGSIKAAINSLNQGRIPCGCALIPKWSEYQTRIRVKRECKKRSYIFYGWFGEYKGNKTKLSLMNTETNNTWNTTTISDFFAGCGDPVAGRLRTKLAARRPDEGLIGEFLKTKSFIEGTEFYRDEDRTDSEGYYSYWNYTCPKCSEDEYVKAGVCSGVFTSALVSLKAGNKSCRCSEGYRWTKEQRRYQINKKLSKIGGNFLTWIDQYKNSFSRFEYKCFNEVKHETSINTFINNTCLCNCCHGYSRNLEGNLYITLWYSEDQNVVLIKFGITNRDIKEREREQRRHNTPLISKLLYSYSHKDGGLISDIEAELKNNLKEHLTVPKYILPDGYTEAFFYKEDLLNYVKNYVEERLYEA